MIADDGELQELRAVLGAMDVPFTEPSRADRDAAGLHADLLFTTPRHALALQPNGPGGARIRARDHVVVLDAASRTLGRVLERSGCDFVLRAPVHDEVYRLLVARALYRGRERRQHPRVAFGAPVKVRLGRRTRSATLSQLSRRGCGLVLEAALEPGAAVSVILPPELTGGARLAIEGSVVVSRDPVRGESGGRHHAVVFRRLSADAARQLRRLLDARSRSEPTLVPDARSPEPRPGPASPPPVAASPPAADSRVDAGETPDALGTERRRARRAAFSSRVLVSGGGAARVLAGRDLSTGGMRVEPDACLALGDELKLALYGRPGTPAILVRAVVARDAGPRGWVLHFTDLTPTTAAHLQSLVASLPCLAQKPRGAPEPGTVVTEIVGPD